MKLNSTDLNSGNYRLDSRVSVSSTNKRIIKDVMSCGLDDELLINSRDTETQLIQAERGNISLANVLKRHLE